MQVKCGTKKRMTLREKLLSSIKGLDKGQWTDDLNCEDVNYGNLWLPGALECFGLADDDSRWDICWASHSRQCACQENQDAWFAVKSTVLLADGDPPKQNTDEGSSLPATWPLGSRRSAERLDSTLWASWDSKHDTTSEKTNAMETTIPLLTAGTPSNSSRTSSVDCTAAAAAGGEETHEVAPPPPLRASPPSRTLTRLPAGLWPPSVQQQRCSSAAGRHICSPSTPITFGVLDGHGAFGSEAATQAGKAFVTSLQVIDVHTELLSREAASTAVSTEPLGGSRPTEESQSPFLHHGGAPMNLHELPQEVATDQSLQRLDTTLETIAGSIRLSGDSQALMAAARYAVTVKTAEAYKNAQEAVLLQNIKRKRDFGTTAVTVCCMGRFILIANCGDSTAMLVVTPTDGEDPRCGGISSRGAEDKLSGDSPNGMAEAAAHSTETHETATGYVSGRPSLSSAVFRSGRRSKGVVESVLAARRGRITRKTPITPGSVVSPGGVPAVVPLPVVYSPFRDVGAKYRSPLYRCHSIYDRFDTAGEMQQCGGILSELGHTRSHTMLKYDDTTVEFWELMDLGHLMVLGRQSLGFGVNGIVAGDYVLCRA